MSPHPRQRRGHDMPSTLGDWVAQRARGYNLDGKQIRDWLADLDRDPRPLPEHVGLWLDRCLPNVQDSSSDGKGEQPGREALYRLAIAALRIGPGGRSSRTVEVYRDRFKRHRARARSRTPGARRIVVEVEATSRILLHPATGTSVTDGSLLLHHTYGVPYLPGTALKGGCRSHALSRWDPATVRALFGCTEESGEGDGRTMDHGKDEKGHAGLFDFWDALWIPESPRSRNPFSPLALDVVTPHHGDYYIKPPGERERAAPRETDSPIPARLMSYSPGTRFLVVLEYADVTGINAWVDEVKSCLLEALEAHGIGAKTAAGYGRLKDVAADSGRASSRPEGDRSVRTTGASAEAGGTGLAFLSLQKNSGTLVAALAGGGGSAVARGAPARTLIQDLPEDIRTRLNHGKAVRVKIRWSPLGRAKQLEEVLVG